MKRRDLLTSIILLPGALGWIPSGAQAASGKTKERLMERVTTYWDAFKARDFATMYGLEVGSLDGSLQPAAIRRGAGRSKLEGYSLGEVEIDGDRAKIMVERSFTISGMRDPIKMPLTDYWLFHDGDWYRTRASRPTKEDASAK